MFRFQHGQRKCGCNETQCTLDRAEIYLFHDRDRRSVLPENGYCTQI